MIKDTVVSKLISTAVLIVVLLFPFSRIMPLIHEREQRRNQVTYEVSSKWGNAQTLRGPILTIPYKKIQKLDKNTTETYDFSAHFLPDTLNVQGTVSPEVRYRGIYKVALYNAQLTFTGTFPAPFLDEWNAMQKETDGKNESIKVLWEHAFISIGIPDLRGIREQVKLKWNNQSRTFDPGSKAKDLFSSGLNVRTPLDPKTVLSRKNTFSFTLDINGSNDLNFIPVGKETFVNLQSSWKDPSFIGAFLPDKREITDKGFKASWKVLNLNRNFPQKWTDSAFSFTGSEFGVILLFPVDVYQKTTRSAKYAIMFIFLTFLIFFFVEILNKRKIHPIQYLLVGAAIVLFYTLLLSLSEHISFNKAYWLASAAIIVMISAYSLTVLGGFFLAMVMGGLLSSLYVFLYVVLQLQDYSLLLGNIGLFIVLAIIMFVTRKIDWYAIGEKPDTQEPAKP